MKIVTRAALVLCFCLFVSFPLITPSHAEEYYTYKDPDGNLVISNKPPPAGSSVLKKQDLPETVGPQVSQPTHGADAQQPDARPETSPQSPPKSR